MFLIRIILILVIIKYTKNCIRGSVRATKRAWEEGMSNMQAVQKPNSYMTCNTNKHF